MTTAAAKNQLAGEAG